MKKNELNIFLSSIVIGFIIGTVISILEKLKITNIGSNIIIVISLGFAIAIICSVCLISLINTYMNRYVSKKGVKTNAKIEDVSRIMNPKNFSDDNEWCQNARYVLKISYEVNKKIIIKELAPTPEISKQKLYPIAFSKGENIPIRYNKRIPYFSIIDNEFLVNKTLEEQKSSRKYVVITPILLTMIYFLSVICLFK